MNLLMLAFIICGLLTQVTKASFETTKCWKNDIGRCRSRCLDNERYILLCRNKLSCCIPIEISHDFTRRPILPWLLQEDITFGYSDEDTFTGSPISRPDDMVTFNLPETTGTEIISPESTSEITSPQSMPSPSGVGTVTVN
ncbi:PREDICTED: beta-defensin 125 [Galeopterus variegatus]|uniref:Beta-defensin n=1 Tax=Galeopterus variegatus TaxID=482537 RepID=A0ABM0RJW1_GALVR|nr:PREDICTED: beta-defensin 125 [Galeopterus variegatus]